MKTIALFIAMLITAGHAAADITNAFVVSENAGDIAILKGSDTIAAPPVYTTNTAWSYYRTNCALWYSFDSSETNYAIIPDRTGNGNTGLVFALASPLPNCLSNDAFQVNAVYESYLRTAVSGIGSNATEITIASWVYISVSQAFNAVTIQNKNNPGYEIIPILANDQHALITPASSSAWDFYLQKDTNYFSCLTPSSTLSSNAWHRLVLAYRKNGSSGTATATYTIYVDGAQIGNTSTALNFFQTPGYWFIGLPVSVAGVYRAQVDDFVIDLHYWSLAMATNDYALGRSRTLVLP